MPELWDVSTTAFDALLRRAEVRLTAPRANLWQLSNIITPVSIVDSGAVLTANVNVGPQSFATEGSIVNAAAGALLADTGQLAAGTWEIEAHVTNDITASLSSTEMQHRNAANDGDIWNYAKWTIGGRMATFFFRERFLLNERFRIINTNLRAGDEQGFIFFRLLP